MYPQEDESNLLRQASKGDRNALAEIYERYVDAVYHFMYYRTQHETVAEDLTAEVFAQVVTAIERYEDRGLPFGAWLFRIARARLVDYIRRQNVRDTLPLSEETISSQVTPSPERMLTDLYFSHLLQYLTDEQQEVVILRFVGGLNNAEIAEVIGSNANAVKQKVFRALTRLRAVLGKERGEHVA
ncbi:MAG: sigma-70 family RNA polymerase sigma factor [Anaerolineae bacterium]|jgi:RNA polymerase sigma-70 factor (ECF subfamily)